MVKSYFQNKWAVAIKLTCDRKNNLVMTAGFSLVSINVQKVLLSKEKLQTSNVNIDPLNVIKSSRPYEGYQYLSIFESDGKKHRMIRKEQAENVIAEQEQYSRHSRMHET